MPADTFRITIDANENYPPTFPRCLRVTHYIGQPARLVRVEIAKKRLSAPTAKRPYNYGDYAPLDYKVNGRVLIAVDKKGSPHEIMQNVEGSPRERARFLRSLDLFASSVVHPYIWLDMGWKALWERAPAFVRRTGPIDPAPALGALFHELQSRGIGLLGPVGASSPQERLYAGQYLAHWMYARCHPRALTPSSLAPAVSDAVKLSYFPVDTPQNECML